ncbi:pectate lyase [Cerasicoccus arenae]|uniref:Uncharacterized protein n=1 Tax=Cerasicoccus arenae TaxID=424488 RepID=A0A8J3DJ08_9BACT|nr:pectate lyase [Cerasicoccus arenae]MBK1859949.1 hypothetical protein [Cerasicoccus arenae]GHC08472.1 hypothetical protein GCM10007047_27210 [Cerasicoccus arenae]
MSDLNLIGPNSTPETEDLSVKSPLMGSVKLSDVVNRSMVLRSMNGIASWMKAASESTDMRGKMHRMAVYDYCGNVNWMYPNSNTAESISAWLDLSEALNRPAYIQKAIEYAIALIDDNKGLYSGPEKDAHGMMWYWTDAGVYSSLYSMRVPAQFIRLYKYTGDERLLNALGPLGETLLTNQLSNGLVGSGWSPTNGWCESGSRIGSRFVYVVATYATLYQHSQDNRYREAYERAIGALLKMQRADGSFYQHYDLSNLEMSVTDCSTKCMFFAYILNAIAEAYAVFEDERLLNCARRLGNFITRLYYCRGALPYCIGDKLLVSDQPEANMSMYECANGLLWLYGKVPDERFKDIGLRLWITAWLNQAEVTENPDLNGAILVGSDPMVKKKDKAIPSNRMHLAYDPSRAAKCVLWGMVNHTSSCKRLLDSKSILNEKSEHSTGTLLARG